MTKEEYIDFGFDDIESFNPFLLRAEMSINLFIDYFYEKVDFETDFEQRKKAVKLATAFQINYLDRSGMLSAEDKQSVASVNIGRTSVSFNNGSTSDSYASQYNLSLDCLNYLKSAGFGFRGVCYDR